jgi:GNAT superfamily N-acetyltransferase
MRVRQLDTENKEDVRQFVEFPFDLYRDCPQWVPPLVSDSRDILNRNKHPFYEHSTAEFFVVEDKGRALGRISALENRNFNKYQKRKAAFFGYFEVVENQAAAQALLDAVAEWALARGLNEIIGPRGVIGIDGSVLVEGFEHRPALGIPYNYPYYDAFIKAAGYEKDTDYLSGYADLTTIVFSERVKRIMKKVKERRGYKVKSFSSRGELRRWVPEALKIHRKAMGGLHTYYPPTEAEVERVIGTIATIADPRMIKLVLKGDETVGFALAYPDISAGLQKARGRLWPLGWIPILLDRYRTKWVNVNGLGLLPEYQGLGANTMLYYEVYTTLINLGYEHVDMVQVNESNFASRSDMESLGATWYKRHRHYCRTL